jgi:hypothetical protein
MSTTEDTRPSNLIRFATRSVLFRLLRPRSPLFLPFPLLLDTAVMSPFQATFTLFIIGGAFSAAGLLIGGINYLYEGKKERDMFQDSHFDHRLDQRNRAIKQVYYGGKKENME